MTTQRFAVRSTQTAALLLLGVGLLTFPIYGQDLVSIFDGSSLKGWKVEHNANEALPQTVEHVARCSERGARSEAGPR